MFPEPFSEKTDEERVNAVLNHPFFMANINEENMDSDTVSALQSLVFDGTPEEAAENFKVQGNTCYAMKKYEDAVKFYTQAIDSKSADDMLNSSVYSNRAAVNLELSNFGSVLRDCALAIRCNSKNIKAYFRSIKALIALDRVDEGIDCCRKAIELDPDFETFHMDLKRLQDRKRRLEEIAAVVKRKVEETEKTANIIKDALVERNYRSVETGSTESLQHPDAAPYRIEFVEGELCFPVVFLYPEFNQSDVISSFGESDTFCHYFEQMFSSRSPWDGNHLYQPQNLDWYFETHTEKYAKESRKLVSVLRSVSASGSPSQDLAQRYVFLTLGDVLRSNQFTIVNGVVTFILFSRNSSDFSAKYRAEFLKINI